MAQASGREPEDALRTHAARLVQVMRQHLRAQEVPPEMVPMIGPVRHLARLLDAGAPAALLQEAALSVVDVYEWPGPDASGSDEDPVILAAVERLRAACDAVGEANGSAANGGGAADSGRGAESGRGADSGQQGGPAGGAGPPAGQAPG